MLDSPIFILVAVVVWLWLYRALYNLSVSQVSLQCKCVSQFPLSNSGLVVTSYPPFDRLKEQKNLNSFFAVMFGLGNSAVHRLHKTWEVREASAQQAKMLTWTASTVVSLFMLPLFAENPQQDKENLLCLREADGEGSMFRAPFLDAFYHIFMWCSLPLLATHCRIRRATTGLTDWQWPSWVLLTSPSCLCCWKVRDSSP